MNAAPALVGSAAVGRAAMGRAAGGAILGGADPTGTAGRAPWRDAVAVAVGALLLRVALVGLFGANVPAADDGVFYEVVARRIAQGLGYTWQWPDGVVTYAAHYPVGYAGLLGAAHALFGPSRQVAFLVNAALGALGVLGTHRVAARVSGRLGALLAALCVALSPTLLGYTLALMTEGAVAAAWIVAAWCALVASEAAPGSLRRRVAFVLTAGVLGAAVLVRPQSLLLGPMLGYVASAGVPRRWRFVQTLAVPALALAVCLPWTARNCARMDRCVVVSANGGWNLLIGTFPEGGGAFVPIDAARVPDACRDVFAEAAKDACFGAAGRQRILGAPLPWLRLIPDKLRHTFDFTASAAAYLGSAGALPEGPRLAMGAVEVAFRRLLVGLALFGALWSGHVGIRGRGRRASAEQRPSGGDLPGGGVVAEGRLRWSVFVVGAACLLGSWAWLSHLLLAGLALTAREPARRPTLFLAAGALLATALVHAAFFGAGRYSMVLEPLLASVAAAGFVRRARRRGPGEGLAAEETPERMGAEPATSARSRPARERTAVFDSVA
jgi:4-amino-4-deoxy-L-arabinose transferase-like glycosyltransferase